MRREVFVMYVIVAINGYGAPEYPERDENLTVYLNSIMNFCAELGQKGWMIELRLLGGPTNRASMTEAGAMTQWIQAHGKPSNVVSIHLHTETTDLRGNIESLRDIVKGNRARVYYFCETSRLPAVRFLSLWYLGWRVRVRGRKVDDASLRLEHRLQQLGPKLFLEAAAAVFGGWFERKRLQLRAAHIAKHRRLAGEDP
jgi:hypothetical protein